MKVPLDNRAINFRQQGSQRKSPPGLIKILPYQTHRHASLNSAPWSKPSARFRLLARIFHRAGVYSPPPLPPAPGLHAPRCNNIRSRKQNAGFQRFSAFYWNIAEQTIRTGRIAFPRRGGLIVAAGTPQITSAAVGCHNFPSNLGERVPGKVAVAASIRQRFIGNNVAWR